MKSKKKLIYKLHENINENPFKKIDEVSFRNAGIGSYDFNKLKSIRAISLKGLESEEIHSDKNLSDWKKKYDLKMNMVSIKQEIQQKAQQALICNKKKIVIDKTLMNTQSKKLNIRSLLKEKHLESKYHPDQNNDSTDKGKRHQTTDHQQQENQNYKTEEITDFQRHNLPARVSPRPKYQQGHSRNISLPVIKNQREQIQNSIAFVSPKHQLDILFDEQKAKEQILRQIRLNAQEKINKQVLMSIKLKSIQNLQRIARSQSEVIKIDKWKQKYGQVKNSQDFRLKQKLANSKYLLPEIQQKFHKKQQYESPKYLKHSKRYMESNDQQLEELQKSSMQLAKHLLNNVSVEEPIFSYNSTVLNRSPALQTYLNEQNFVKQLDQQFCSQTLKKRQEENIEFWYSQPLKITITQLKNHAGKIQQNQNLSKEGSNLLKLKGKFRTIQVQNKGIEEFLESHQPNQNQLQSNQAIIQRPQLQKDQNLPYQSQNPFKTRSTLYMKLQKDQTTTNSQIGLTNKKAGTHRCKINDKINILNKIVEDGAPMEWELNKHADDQEIDFHTFVENEAKAIEEREKQGIQFMS